MEKKIHDQLEESNAKKQLRVSLPFETALFGTGIMKGPFAVDKEYPNWDEKVYSPLFKTVPQTSHVSIWNFYPDPDASNMDEAEFIIERHKMSRSQLRALKKDHSLERMLLTNLLMKERCIIKSGGNMLWKITTKKTEPKDLKF